MFAKNISTFLQHLVHEGAVRIDLDDEITRDTLLVRDGEVVQPRIREILGLAPTNAAGVGR
jgi:NAD(P) transhydrogenase subunit alpha